MIADEEKRRDGDAGPLDPDVAEAALGDGFEEEPDDDAPETAEEEIDAF